MSLIRLGATEEDQAVADAVARFAEETLAPVAQAMDEEAFSATCHVPGLSALGVMGMNLPERFDIGYINEAGERVRPVMLHRALFGSLERFIGILIEHHAGTFPAWLAPVQAVAFNITDAQSDYVRELVKQLKNKGVRVVADLRNEKLGYKVREHTLQRVPYLLVAGERERSEGTVSVRDVAGKDLGAMTPELVAALMQRMPASA